MIKFFRRIRYDLIEKNKTGKYFKYAIGEIILVMVGILLALQVNNWNQQRIAAQKEQLLLEALHNEFVENKSQLANVVSWHEKALVSTQYVISQFPIDPKTINLDTLDERMKYWYRRYTFNPSQGVIRSLVNTSSFELITDTELRALLVSWEDVLADYQEDEEMASKILMEQHVPEIFSHSSRRLGLTDKRVNTDFLASYQFENIFIHRELHLKTILGQQNDDGELDRIKATIDRIIELSKSEQ
jgi:hypothetical protein